MFIKTGDAYPIEAIIVSDGINNEKTKNSMKKAIRAIKDEKRNTDKVEKS